MARATDVRVEMLKAVGMPEALIGSAGAQVSLYGAENVYNFVILPGAATAHLPRRRGDGVLVGVARARVIVVRIYCVRTFSFTRPMYAHIRAAGLKPRLLACGEESGARGR